MSIATEHARTRAWNTLTSSYVFPPYSAAVLAHAPVPVLEAAIRAAGMPLPYFDPYVPPGPLHDETTRRFVLIPLLMLVLTEVEVS